MFQNSGATTADGDGISIPGWDTLSDKVKAAHQKAKKWWRGKGKAKAKTP